MKIILSRDFTSDARKSHFIDMTSWFASYQLDKIEPFLHEEVEWSLVGDQPISGRAAFLKALSKMQETKAKELYINQVLIDGSHVVISGEMSMDDHSKYSFIDIHTLISHQSNITAHILSYVILLADK